MSGYVLALDQSTQSTKALLFDEHGKILKRVDQKHKQKINEQGHVSHDPMELYCNTLATLKEVIQTTAIDPAKIKVLGISNQRETTLMWDETGKPYADAIVWQCDRAKEIAQRYTDKQELIYEISGLPLSPYFPASKMRWLLEEIQPKQPYYFGTIDAWLIYCLTNKQSYKTDVSNASRTQLFDIHSGTWSKTLCELFDIPMEALPEVCDSDAHFGYSDLEGFLAQPIPIYAVMGDSHAALYGQGCHAKGQVKATLGTGSSIMMNIGSAYRKSKNHLATSLAWKIDGVMDYVLEGNINYAGAVITWLQEALKLIQSPADLDEAIARSNPKDETILVPAFSGLSAPYWNDEVRAMFYGMSRTTGRNELIKATVDSIAFQISDVLRAMESDSGIEIAQVKADGGPSKNTYLMGQLSNIANTIVAVSKQEELSAIGVAYLAGIRVGLYEKDTLFQTRTTTQYTPMMDEEQWNQETNRWKQAISCLLQK